MPETMCQKLRHYYNVTVGIARSKVIFGYLKPKAKTGLAKAKSGNLCCFCFFGLCGVVSKGLKVMSASVHPLIFRPRSPPKHMTKHCKIQCKRPKCFFDFFFLKHVNAY